MPVDSNASADRQPAPLNKGSILVRLGAIGVVILSVVGVFGYLGGWFTPSDLTPARFIDTFEQVNGAHPGFRRNHAKGGMRQWFF